MANNMEQVKRREGRLSEKSCVGEGSEGRTEWERRRDRPPPSGADLALVVRTAPAVNRLL